MTPVSLDPASRIPYPGLRPFRENESDLFFGREHQTDELLGRLQRHRFIAVTGPSGCGKSSLITAGVVPALLGGLMGESGARWRIAQMRPGDSPIRALATALASPEIVGEAATDAASPEYIEAALRFGPLGLAQSVRESPVLHDSALFLLVDQFEEIFRFRDRIDPDEADSFVRLLLETAAQSDLRAYVVITMRSDYLGDCTVFAGLPEAINNGQYLTPRLTREECSMAIRGPARVCSGDVDAALVNRLLNDFGPDPDQLPLLQHALMRMWRRRAAVGGATCMVLAVDDYTDRLGEALDRHAEEVYGKLSPQGQRLAELMFRRLTERARGQRDTRAPARVGEVAAIAGCSIEALEPVAEAFRREGCNFVVAAPGPFRDATLLDIGHESLIRQWKRLSAWVDAEAESAAIYVRLADAARRHDRGQAALLWKPDLQQALQWQADEHPSEPWASRYRSGVEQSTEPGAEFHRVVTFLEDSRAAWDEAQESRRRREEAERQSEIDEARRQAEIDAARAEAQRAQSALELERTEELAAIRRRRIIGLGVTVLLLLLTVLGLWGDYRLRKWMLTPTEEAFVSFVSKYGVARGIGPPLTADQVARRAVSYVITTKCRRLPGEFGRWLIQLDALIGSYFSTAGGECPNERVVEMRAINADGKLTTEHSAELSALGKEEAGTARKAVRWQYIYDDDGRIAYEVEFDRKGRQVRSLVYSPADRGPMPTQRTRQLFDAGGFPLPPSREMCASTETVEFSSPGGFEWRYRYKDRLGNPVPGRDHVPVQEKRWDEKGFLLEFISLDVSGDGLVPIDDAAGNASVKFSDFNSFGQARRMEYFGADGKPVEIEGVALEHWTFDEVGNVTEVRRLDGEGRPAAGSDGWHRRALEYGDKGVVTRETFWGTDERPATQADYCHELRWTYDPKGRRRIGGACIGTDGGPGGAEAPRWRIEYEDDNVSGWSNWDASGQKPVTGRGGWHRLAREFDDRGNVEMESYFDVHGQPARLKSGQAGVRSTYDKRDQLISSVYLGPDRAPTTIDKGYAEFRFTYDDNGNRTSERYFAADGKTPARTWDGYVGIDFKRDSCGLETERSYVGRSNRPMTIAQGHAGEQMEYDLGRQVKVQFLAANGRPAIRAEGEAGWRDTLDRFGNIVERRYLGPDGRPVANDEGEGGWRRSYDSRGFVTSYENIGASRQVVATDGEEEYRYARTVWTRDALSNVLEEAYFGTRGEPAYLDRGYARLKRSLNAQGQLVEEAYYGASGEAVLTTDGVHRTRYTVDEHGVTVAEMYFGLHGEPVQTTGGFHRIELATDLHGRERGRRFFDLAGRPAVGPEGWHERRNELDPLGRLVGQSFWGADGTPAMSKDNTHHALGRRVDSHGRIREEHYLDQQQRPTKGPHGVPVMGERYDERGRNVELSFRDAAGQQLMLNNLGYARMVTAFDDRGRKVTESFFGADRRLINLSSGQARSEFVYDVRQETERRFRADGSLPAGPGAFATRVTRHDAFGRDVETTWYDGLGLPTAVGEKANYARLTYAYDEYGRWVDYAGYVPDILSPPDFLAFGFRVKERYDPLGRVVEQRHVDAQGELVNWPDGVARFENRFDAHGWVLKTRCFDSAERLVKKERNSYDARGHVTLRRFFDAKDHPIFVSTEVGMCAALRWHPDERGKSPIPDGECLDTDLQPVASRFLR